MFLPRVIWSRVSPGFMMGHGGDQRRQRAALGYFLSGCLLGPIAESRQGHTKFPASLGEPHVGDSVLLRERPHGLFPNLVVQNVAIVFPQ